MVQHTFKLVLSSQSSTYTFNIDSSTGNYKITPVTNNSDTRDLNIRASDILNLEFVNIPYPESLPAEISHDTIIRFTTTGNTVHMLGNDEERVNGYIITFKREIDEEESTLNNKCYGNIPIDGTLIMEPNVKCSIYKGNDGVRDSHLSTGSLAGEVVINYNKLILTNGAHLDIHSGNGGNSGTFREPSNNQKLPGTGGNGGNINITFDKETVIKGNLNIYSGFGGNGGNNGLFNRPNDDNVPNGGESGNGGNGGNINITFGEINTTEDITITIEKGGNGGNGGDNILDNNSQLLYGTKGGNGGNSGNITIEYLNIYNSCYIMSSIGGNGGNSGSSINSIYGGGGNGGDGGDIYFSSLDILNEINITSGKGGRGLDGYPGGGPGEKNGGDRGQSGKGGSIKAAQNEYGKYVHVIINNICTIICGQGGDSGDCEGYFKYGYNVSGNGGKAPDYIFGTNSRLINNTFYFCTSKYTSQQVNGLKGGTALGYDVEGGEASGPAAENLPDFIMNFEGEDLIYYVDGDYNFDFNQSRTITQSLYNDTIYPNYTCNISLYPGTEYNYNVIDNKAIISPIENTDNNINIIECDLNALKIDEEPATISSLINSNSILSITHNKVVNYYPYLLSNPENFNIRDFHLNITGSTSTNQEVNINNRCIGNFEMIPGGIINLDKLSLIHLYNNSSISGFGSLLMGNVSRDSSQNNITSSLISYSDINLNNNGLSILPNSSLYIPPGYNYTLPDNTIISGDNYVGKFYMLKSTPNYTVSQEATQQNIIKLFESLDNVRGPINTAKNNILETITGDNLEDITQGYNTRIIKLLDETKELLTGKTTYDYSYNLSLVENSTVLVYNFGSDIIKDFARYRLYYHDGEFEYEIIYNSSEGFYYQDNNKHIPLEIGTTNLILPGEELVNITRLSSFGKLVPLKALPLKGADIGNNIYSFDVVGLNIYCY